MEKQEPEREQTYAKSVSLLGDFVSLTWQRKSTFLL